MIFCWMFLACLFLHYGSTVMPINQHNRKIPKSQLYSPSTIKYNNIHLKSKTNMRKVQEKPITEINRVYSQIMPLTRAKNYQNMANKEKETKQQDRYNILDFKSSKQKSSESRITSQKENKLSKLKSKREAEYFLSVTKRKAKSKNIKSSYKTLEGVTLESKEITQIISNSGSEYVSTTFQNIFITKPSEIQRVLPVSQNEIWFLSDDGFDKHNCQMESTPCRNLQTVLDRASDGADIYVTSETLSLDLVNDTVWYTMSYWILTGSCCLINSSLSYTLRSINGTKTNITCSSKHCCLLLYMLFYLIFNYI